VIRAIRPTCRFAVGRRIAVRRRFFSTVARTDVELLCVPGDEMQALLRRRREVGRRREDDLSPDKNSSVARGNGAPRRR
jgi:hypothetical protein